MDFSKRIEEQYQKEKKSGSYSDRINQQYQKEKAAEKAKKAKKKKEDDDIAPVKTTNKSTWFKAGAFSDGYDTGDITKTIIGTGIDITENLSAGVARIAEGALDIAPIAIGSVASAAGNDKLANEMKDFARRNLVEEYDIDKNLLGMLPGGNNLNVINQSGKALNIANQIVNGGLTEEYSIFGEKSQGLIQSGAQMAGTIGLQAIGVPWWLTTGVTAFDAGVEEAFNEDAGYKDALTYGAISSGAEILTEKLGGIKFGGKTLLDEPKKKLANAITKKTVSSLARFGFDAASEGGEEVLSEVIQNIGKKLTYEDDKTVGELLASEEAMDGYIDSFIGGAVMGGAFSSGKLYNSIKTGRDYDSGLTDNEQRIVDTVVNKRATEKQKQAAVNQRVSEIVAQREEKFGTLSESKKKKIRQNVQNQLDKGKLDFTSSKIEKKEMSAIEEQVREDLNRGLIDIDSIGDIFSSEKTAEIRTLTEEKNKTTDETKKADIQDKLDELTKSRLLELDQTLEKDTILKESLKQEVLKGMTFTREVSDKDSEITKNLVKSLQAVGANNTRRTHDLFEYIDKIANQSNVKYEFTNTAELQDMADELGIDETGTKANGMVVTTKDGETKVLINADSKQAFNFVVGHETTHLLEGTEDYQTLQKLIKEYATNKDDYTTRLKSITKLYEGTNADVYNEVTADLVGDYLFNDEHFIQELTSKRNIFQKFYDYIKHTYKLATAGSSEKRQLEQVKYRFDKVYREMSKAAKAQDGVNVKTAEYAIDKKTEKAVDVNEKRYILKNSDSVSYDNLLRLKEIKTTTIEERFDSENDYEINERMDAAIQSSERVEDGTGYIKMEKYPYTITVTKSGLRHGLVGKHLSGKQQRKSGKSFKRGDREYNNANISDSFGEIVKNAVVVNELSDRSGGLVLMGYAESEQNGYAVRIVAKKNGDYYSLESWDSDLSLYAVNTKKIEMHRNVSVPTEQGQSPTLKNSTNISMEEFLRIVNDISPNFASVLSDDVLQHFDNKKSDKSEIATRFSLSDNKGRILSEEQQDYFKDSKVRDDNGALKVMYHGTPDGEFNIFNDGTYFTENKEYADRYQNPSASSISSGKQATNPKTFEVYLDIKNPFDLSDPEARDVYINEYIKGGNAVGINPYLPDAEYDKIQTIDWTEGEDLRDFLIDEGYDYDGLVLDEGADGGYGDDVQQRGKSYVVFKPSQIKNVVNVSPTGNKDIRYSLSNNDTKNNVFSLSSPVEQGKELIAVHNMHAAELIKTLDLGGFPMPSIAVIKAQSGHSKYGDVSVVFGKDTIDPELIHANKLYGGDAWTPVYPKIEYKANAKAEKRIHDFYYDFARKHGHDEARPLYRYAQELEEELNRNNGAEGIIERLSDDTSLMQMYLMDSGKDKVENIERKVVTELPEDEVRKYDYLVKALGEDVIRSSQTPPGTAPMAHRKKWMAEHSAELEQTYSNFLTDIQGLDEKNVENIIANQKMSDYIKMVLEANRYLKNGARTVKTEVDTEATNEKIREAAGDGYTEWLNNLFDGVEEKSGIRNDVDLFTRSGNRRKWESLHYENTLENVVKVMKKGVNGQGFLGGNIFGASVKGYNSIDEMKADSSRLQRISQDEYEAISDSYNQRLTEICDSIMDKTAENSLLAMDEAMNAIVDAVRTSKTKSGIMNALKSYGQLKVTETAVNDIADLVTDISNMPTEYFEAKPKRAVELNEIEAVLVPSDADAAFVDRLKDNGYNVIQYEAGNEADRAAKLNELDDLKFSLSTNIAPVGGYQVYSEDILKPKKSEATSEVERMTEVEEDIAPVAIEEESYESVTEDELPYFEQERDEAFENMVDDYVPVDEVEQYNLPDTNPIDKKALKLLSRNMKEELGIKNSQVSKLEQIIQEFSTSEDATMESLYDAIESEFGTVQEQHKIDEIKQIKKDLRELRIKVSDTIKGDIPDFFQFKQKNFGKIRISNQGMPVDDVYEGFKSLYPGYFPEDISNPTDQLLKMVEVANMDSVYTEEYFLPEEQIQEVTDFIYESVNEYKREKAMNASHELAPLDESMIPDEEMTTEVKREPVPSDFDANDFSNVVGVQQELDTDTQEIVEREDDVELDKLERKKQRELKKLGDLPTYTKRKANQLYHEVRTMTKGVRVSPDLGIILDRMFEGVDRDAENYKEIKNATYKRITDALVRTQIDPEGPRGIPTPTEEYIRYAIKTWHERKVDEINSMQLDSRAEARRKLRKELKKELLGVSEKELTDALDRAKNIPMILMNNTDTIRNTELVFGRENGKKINKAIFQKEIDNEARSIAWQNKERAEIKQLGIKARSAESAAVQKYGEKQYMNEFGEVMEYGDEDLAAEFPNEDTQNKIKIAAAIIREKYDNYIDLANETLTKLGFDAIKKRKDYMRHFQELNDVFTVYGLPFNPQAMKEHDLPTDISGLTEFWSPQKNYFANMKQREGMRTTLDAITGIDGYIGGIANLIYHTEDIQRGRAFEEIIRDTYGQESGWENIEELKKDSPQEYQARADMIQNNHLSNYAAWVHEWTNNIAGKKDKVDRSIEAKFGRKGLAILDEARKQVGANMIGMNISSSLTNLIAPVQAMAKTNKLAVVKGTADTVKNIFVKDDFMEKNNFLISRMGTESLAKTPLDKVKDAGYLFMKGMDWFASNQIVRSKYYELRSKGIAEEEAHAEAGEFAARILGDRTKGANAQIYNSKLIGLVTQFQLEVNNQLYSMFYDTYHESKENAKGNAKRMAAGMTFTLGQLAAYTHMFGKTFESIAGYNPTFDIIGILGTALGVGDDDDDGKTMSERLKAAADELVDALPYVSVVSGGGRIPVASAIPNLLGVVTGQEDQYGNQITLKDELKKVPMLLAPVGGNQIKKTYNGLKMFDKDLPVSGSYTDSGKLRFPVEDNLLNRAQAAVFGQWANENARAYFDGEQAPLNEKQIQEYKELDIPISDYWDYQKGLKKQKKNKDKLEYISGLDLPVSKKNLMANNVVDRKEKVDMSNYDNYDEFDFSSQNPEKYQYLQENNISYEEYKNNKETYDWAYKNPEKCTVAKAVGDVVTYRQLTSTLGDIKGEKDKNGKTISGSRKQNVANYINGLDLDYGAKLVLFKSEYPSYDDANWEIVEYLNDREDISYNEMETILKELGFTVDIQGNITW